MIRRALLLVAAITLLAPAGAAAQTRPSARLGLASQTPWVRGSATFVMRIDVDAVRAPQQLELVVTVHRAVRSRSQFARTIEGDSLGSSVQTTRVAFDTLRFDPSGAIQLRVDQPTLRTGVYPVSVALVDEDTDEEVASLVTHLLKVPTDAVETPLSVAWVQPYGADPALQPDGTTVLDDDRLDDLRTIASQLDGDAPLTITPTPETIAALAALDDGQTIGALAELLADHQVVSSPYVDVDLSAMVEAGRLEDLATQRVEGDRVLDELLGLSVDNRTWTAAGVATPDSLDALDRLGVRRVVLDEDALEPLASGATSGLTLTRPFIVRGDDAELDAVAADPGLAAHFDRTDEVLAAHHLLADLAVLQLDLPGVARGVVIRPPQDWRPSEAFLSASLPNIVSSPLLRPVTLDRFFDTVAPLRDGGGDDVVRTLADAEPPSLGFSAVAVDRARATISALGSLLVEPTSTDLAVLERLLLVAESSDLDPAGARRYIDEVSARVSGATANVRVLGDQTFRLTAREGTIPLRFVNDNPFAVRVEIELASDKLTFTDSGTEGRPERRELVLQANSTTTEAVPVKARTSGTFSLRVTVRSPDRRLELGASQLTITSTVASGIGLLLSVGAALFLLLWWGKHWRTVRRSRRLVPAE